LPVSLPSPAMVDMKYSVPLRSFECSPGGEIAGHTVNPGEPSTLVFSTRVIRMLGVCAASSCLEKAKICAAL
jgi:hypothetical protein